MKLHEVQKILNDKTKELHNLKLEYEKKVNKLQKDIQECNRLIQLSLANADLNKVEIAESVLSFGNGFNRLDYQVVNDAIRDIAESCTKLKSEYFGIKDYAHWRGQRENHRYGYGPKHGNIVFSIGLKIRDRDLTEDEMDAAIYYLNKLKVDEGFRKNVKGA